MLHLFSRAHYVGHANVLRHSHRIRNALHVVLILLTLTILTSGTLAISAKYSPAVTPDPLGSRGPTSLYLSVVMRSAEPPKLPMQGIYDGCVAYNINCLEHLNLFASQGFRLVLNYGTLWDRSASLISYANRARSLGMKIIWSVPYEAGMADDPAFLIRKYPDLAGESRCRDNACFVRYVVNLVKGHEATWGYYIADEVEPEEHDSMKFYTDLIHATDPAHPRLYVVSGSYEMEQYYRFPAALADLTDVFAPDIYPYGFIVAGDEFTDLTGIISDHTEYWSNRLGLKGAVVLQAFNSVRYDCFSPPCTFPTYEQMKDQRDQAIQYSHPEFILWWTYEDILAERSDSQKHWNDLVAAAFAPLPSGVIENNPYPGICPQGWVCEDIGHPAGKGYQALDGGQWTVIGAGWDISAERYVMADQFRFVYQEITEDRTLSVRVLSQSSRNSRAKAGLMLRKTFDPTSPYYAVYLTPNSAIQIDYRRTFFGNTSRLLTRQASLPAFIRIARAGNVYSAYTSGDGISWSLIPGSSLTLDSLDAPLLAGMAVTSANREALNTAIFEDFSLEP